METDGLIKRLALLLLATSIAAIGLSALWRVPYILTFVGVAALVLAGQRRDHRRRSARRLEQSRWLAAVPVGELLVKAAVVAVLNRPCRRTTCREMRTERVP